MNEEKALKAARLSNGHTQSEAAQIVGVTPRTWQLWEAGDVEPNAAAVKLYETLGTRHYLIDPRNAVPLSEHASEKEAQKAGQRRKNADDLYVLTLKNGRLETLSPCTLARPRDP